MNARLRIQGAPGNAGRPVRKNPIAEGRNTSVINKKHYSINDDVQRHVGRNHQDLPVGLGPWNAYLHDGRSDTDRGAREGGSVALNRCRLDDDEVDLAATAQRASSFRRCEYDSTPFRT